MSRLQNVPPSWNSYSTGNGGVDSPYELERQRAEMTRKRRITSDIASGKEKFDEEQRRMQHVSSALPRGTSVVRRVNLASEEPQSLSPERKGFEGRIRTRAAQQRNPSVSTAQRVDNASESPKREGSQWRIVSRGAQQGNPRAAASTLQEVESIQKDLLSSERRRNGSVDPTLVGVHVERFGMQGLGVLVDSTTGSSSSSEGVRPRPRLTSWEEHEVRSVFHRDHDLKLNVHITTEELSDPENDGLVSTPKNKLSQLFRRNLTTSGARVSESRHDLVPSSTAVALPVTESKEYLALLAEYEKLIAQRDRAIAEREAAKEQQRQQAEQVGEANKQLAEAESQSLQAMMERMELQEKYDALERQLRDPEAVSNISQKDKLSSSTTPIDALQTLGANRGR